VIRKIVNITLYLPNEIRGEERKSLLLEPGDEKEETFTIESSGALPGSSYAVWTSLEYETCCAHCTYLTSGYVKIVEGETDFRILLALAFLFVALLAIFIYFKFVRGV